MLTASHCKHPGLSSWALSLEVETRSSSSWGRWGYRQVTVHGDSPQSSYFRWGNSQWGVSYTLPWCPQLDGAPVVHNDNLPIMRPVLAPFLTLSSCLLYYWCSLELHPCPPKINCWYSHPSVIITVNIFNVLYIKELFVLYNCTILSAKTIFMASPDI